MTPERKDSKDLWKQFQQDLNAVSTLQELNNLRDKYLSRQRGIISLDLKNLASLSTRQRPAAGKRLNEFKTRIGEVLVRKQAELQDKERLSKWKEERVDITLPGYAQPQGRLHPLRRAQEEMEEISVRMGFTIVEGPELEQDYYNFEALNIPKGHPARDAQDTFYVTDNRLLRTHTSPVQIRVMEKQQPPIRIVVPGKVFRPDAVDATHSPMFHQMEGLVVNDGITLADLKGTLEVFLKELFSPETRVRFQPSYFPFVEPGAEVFISCIFCAGRGCRICKNSGWIEIMGAGMVHPRVFQKVGYDHKKYTGFAWGMGIDRIAMLKYQIDDMRLLFENDVRFISQF